MATRRKVKRTAAYGATGSFAAGVVGILLAVWFVSGTITIDPFRWGRFVEELILAFCALFALRLLCVIRLPGWISIASIVLVSAGYFLYAQFALPVGTVKIERSVCLAVSAAIALCIARELDSKPDGTLLAALLAVACLPILAGKGTDFMTEWTRASLLSGIFLSVLAVRRKSSSYLYFAALGFLLGGVTGPYAAFVGAGAGIGTIFFAPKKQRNNWILATVLSAVLPLVSWFTVNRLLPLPALFYQQSAGSVPEYAQILELHLLRTLDLGLLLLSVRFFFHREDAAVPVLFSVAGGMMIRFLPFLHTPDVWMHALSLCALAGVGTAKTARGGTR
ncbi:MAG: hypothetical protein VB034_12250 [Eubacteriales bacterium]|nr:hypothetical protein [Eubacteriales bacterium]